MEYTINKRSVNRSAVCFAGSRRGRVANEVCKRIINALPESRFLVGCAPGVDQCFRAALASSIPIRRCTVHCAFPSRMRETEVLGLRAVCRVSDAPSPSAALHWRTVLMVRECPLLMLFPDNPKTGTWGKGSHLAFNAAVQQHIPVFVVTAKPPIATGQLLVEEGSLFGVLQGHWAIPRGAEVRFDEADCE